MPKKLALFLLLTAWPLSVAAAVKLNIPIGAKQEVAGLGEYVQIWYSFIIGTVGILATVMIMYGGFKWLTSAGDSGKTKEAKEIIISSITGLVLAFLSYTILYLINPKLTIITSPALRRVEIKLTSGDSRVPSATVTNPESYGGGSDINLWSEQNQPIVTQINQLNGVQRVTTYSGHDPDISSAADIWPTNNNGDQVAQYIMEHASELNVSYIIWNQRIWNPSPHYQGDRQGSASNPNGDPSSLSPSQWDLMDDRGNNTQNHLDHIHVSFN